MRASQLPSVGVDSLNPRKKSSLRQSVIGKFPQTERTSFKSVSFQSKNSTDCRLNIDMACETSRNVHQRTIKQSLRIERPLVSSKGFSNHYEFIHPEPQSATDKLEETLKKLRERYKQLIAQNKEIAQKIERRNQFNSLPKINKVKGCKSTESHYISKLQEYERRKVAIAIKNTALESRIEDFIRVSGQYQKKIAYYESRFLGMKKDDKYRVVNNALNLNRFSKFIKSKPMFKQYRMDSQSSVDF